MSVLLQTAVAHLDKTEHPLDDPDRIFGPAFASAISCPALWTSYRFCPLVLVHHAAVAVAAIDEILGPRARAAGSP